jgi:hypothetical protein
MTMQLRSRPATIFGRLRGKAGQAIVLLALTAMLLIGGVGIAVDLAVGYMYSIAAERAAAAAALSGVIFMPDQFSPAQAIPVGSRNDATDRALDEAKRNGFDTADTANGVVVSPAFVPGKPNQLRVIVSRNAPVFFMELFGFQPYRVTRVAVAAYIPPISLGQPGNQLGSSVSQLGTSSFYFMRTEGYATDRAQGDAYTPGPNGGQGTSSDVHSISYDYGSEARDTTVSDRGGYNFRITVPTGGAGGLVQIYNAAFSPDASNYCENDNVNPAARTCNAIRGNYHLHEDDGGPFSYTTTQNYSAMRYSLYRVTNNFIRTGDVLLSQLTVLPIDARNWNQANQQYLNVNTGARITQQYSGSVPSNMLIYHNWVDASSYIGAQDGGLVSLRTLPQLANYLVGGALIPGTYRLRVDTLNANGTVSVNGSQAGAHKAYAVRAVNPDPGRTPCGTCSVAAWNDMAIYTPISVGGGGSFAIKLFRLGPEYAGLTVSIDIYDPGDISSSNGRVVLNIQDPSGATATSPQGVNIYDLGIQRSNLSSGQYSVIASAQNGNLAASFVATDTANGISRGGHWVHVELPVPSNYNPAPGNDWWSLQYVVGANTTATDTITVAVGLRGGPVHLLP